MPTLVWQDLSTISAPVLRDFASPKDAPWGAKHRFTPDQPPGQFLAGLPGYTEWRTAAVRPPAETD